MTLLSNFIKPLIDYFRCNDKMVPNLVTDDETSDKFKSLMLETEMKDWKPDYKVVEQPNGKFALFKRAWKAVKKNDEFVAEFFWHSLTQGWLGSPEPFDTVDEAEQYMYRIIEPEIYYYDTEGRVSTLEEAMDKEQTPSFVRPSI